MDFSGVSAQGALVDDARVVINKQAKQSKVLQTSNSLLVGKNSQAFAEPVLHIDQHDISCEHGATIGYLDQDIINYMQFSWF